MKTSIKLIICILCAYQTLAQITINQPVGLSPGISGIYNPEPNTLPSSFTTDAGTQIYRKVNSVGGGVIVYQFIFRHNNVWKQGVFSTGPDVPPNNANINLATVETCNETIPPCATLWKTANESQFLVSMSGSSCNNICVPPLASEITTDYLRLPTKVTETINQIPNPRNGMMIYDVTTHTVKVFSNGNWRSLNFQ